MIPLLFPSANKKAPPVGGAHSQPVKRQNNGAPSLEYDRVLTVLNLRVQQWPSAHFRVDQDTRYDKLRIWRYRTA